MPLRVIVGVRVLVTVVHVGPVCGPAIVAEPRIRRYVPAPVVAVTVVAVCKRIILCAVEVDSYGTAFAPIHVIGRAFQNLGRCFERRWPCNGLRASVPRRRPMKSNVKPSERAYILRGTQVLVRPSDRTAPAPSASVGAVPPTPQGLLIHGTLPSIMYYTYFV